MDGLIDTFRSIEATRLLFAAGAVAGVGCICLAAILSTRSKKTKAARSASWLVLYSSQTGQAEEIARKTYARLSVANAPAALMALNEVLPEHLQEAKKILCVVSTTGEGDAPDNGMRFERRLMSQMISLADQKFAVLALGDRNYEQYCAFGHRLFNWFTRCGAAALLACLEVNDLDPRALAEWDTALTAWGARSARYPEAGFTQWRLVGRDRLNPQGTAPIYRVRLAPNAPAELAWLPGDLAEIETPDGHRRNYSISSLPSEGRLELLVREVIHRGGGYGKGSGLLIHDLRPGDTLNLRIKFHDMFHRPAGMSPVLLVGAGSGLAGLRSHILDSFEGGRQVWLVYGQRHPDNDGPLCDELRLWRRRGIIQTLDLAFSRPDDGPGQYVQDVLARRATDIRRYLKADGAVLICGGLAMGRAVETTLREIVGNPWVESAFDEGRYRRDLY